MSVDTLTASAMPAESLAQQLNHWQILDIVHVARNGNLQVGSASPWRPLFQLILWGVLKYASAQSEQVKHRVLVPGPRFQAVLYALERAGRIKSLGRAVL